MHKKLSHIRLGAEPVSPPQGSQGSEALVYRGVSSSRSRLATKLGIRDGCTSPSMPSNRRAMRSFLHTDGKQSVVNLSHNIIFHNIIISENAWSLFIHISSPSYLFISQSLALVVMPSNRFLNSETKKNKKHNSITDQKEETVWLVSS